MRSHILISFFSLSLMLSSACEETKAPAADAPPQPAFLVPARPLLPEPYSQPEVLRPPTVLGWLDTQTPTAPAGFKVQAFARGLNNPRWLYELPDGGILVAESGSKAEGEGAKAYYRNPDKAARVGMSGDRILLLRDADGDGVAESRTEFLSGLNQPMGMLLLGSWFYVANTDSLLRFPFADGAIVGAAERILDLPAGPHNERWSRMLTASPDGKKIYVTVGAASHAFEYGAAAEERRANILEINPDGSDEQVYASGLYQVMGMDWADDGQLWATVNEREGLGEGLVPDFLSAINRKDFFGWPYAYYGQNPDPRLQGERPDLIGLSKLPHLSLGAHEEAAGLVFYRSSRFPERYRQGAFIALHGSSASTLLVGYRVVFAPFENGYPHGHAEEFLSGFIADALEGTVWGRPLGLAVNAGGDLLIADDAGDSVWLVRYEGPAL